MLFFISFWVFVLVVAYLVWNNDYPDNKLAAILMALALVVSIGGMLLSVSLFLVKYLP